ncbi:MAG: hypothetical protein QOH67_4656, partial [Hyphomicrobiales bacterium]|nr:hypothetical protein [Hyphomicrobiales bacterium]
MSLTNLSFVRGFGLTQSRVGEPVSRAFSANGFEDPLDQILRGLVTLFCLALAASKFDAGLGDVPTKHSTLDFRGRQEVGDEAAKFLLVPARQYRAIQR